MTKDDLETLHPAYFAMVMATGIVSVAAHLLAVPLVADVLFWLNLVFYAALWLLTFLRLARHGHRFLADLLDHNRCVGFFTMPAGTCVLGAQFILLREDFAAAAVLWFIGLALWLGLTYTVFTILTVKENKPPLERGINGAWLVAVVATQSVSLLGTQLAAHFTRYEEPLLFFTLALWLGGGMLYIWMISLIFYRYTFFPLSPGDLTPPYWINMGAVAISTLAGTLLIAAAPGVAFLQELLPFLKGFTLFFWATATWWIPMLVILGVWRHGYQRFPLRYDPLYWGTVFPLGMYTVCTYRLGHVMALDFVASIARGFVYVALAVWAATFTGLVASLVRRRSSPPAGQHGPALNRQVPS